MVSNQTSQALLARLDRLPRLTVPAVALVLMLVGLMAGPLFAIPALLILVAVVAWLASLAWGQADARGRVVRTLVVAGLVVLLLVRVAGSLG